MRSEKYAGIDYSMSSPAICTHIGNQWDIRNCKFYYLTSVKKLANKFHHGQFQGTLQPKKHENNEKRFDEVSLWTLKHCFKFDFVAIEGYSYSSTGQVFQIGENCGVLKHKLWESNTPFEIYAPSAIKKFATGKGNANKDAMYEAWLKETGIDLMKMMTPTREKFSSPLADIVDSYFIAKYLYFYELSDQDS